VAKPNELSYPQKTAESLKDSPPSETFPNFFGNCLQRSWVGLKYSVFRFAFKIFARDKIA
jgi:hypothetical protein